MTTIAWDGTTLAADRLVTDSGVRVGQANKIRRTMDGRLIGAAGSMAGAREVMDWLDAGGARPSPWPEGVEAIEIMNDGSVRCHESGGVIDMDAGPQVLGSGGKFALAGMACEMDAMRAVMLAIEFDVWSGGRVDVLRLEEAAHV